MSGGYVLIAGILLYIAILRSLDSDRMNPLKAAAFWVIGYYALSSFVLGMEYLARDIPLVSNLLSPVRIVTAVVQFAVAVGIFYKAEDSGDSYMSYIFWGGIGLALIFFIAPMAAQRVLMVL